jgi:hypothetical protein
MSSSEDSKLAERWQPDQRRYAADPVHEAQHVPPAFLSNRLFIPTLKLLQAGDRLESLIPEKLCKNYWQKMKPVVQGQERWLVTTAIPRVVLDRDDHGELDADSLS